MKILGLIIIFSVFTFLGFSKAKDSVSALEDMKRAEFLLKNIVFCLKKENMPINRIFENCIIECDGKTKEFLCSVSLKNLNSIDLIAKKTGFCENKKVNCVLSEAFSVLGKYSAEHQISEIEFCRKKINGIYEKSENDFLSKSKLFRYFGVLAGLFFVILLL